MNRLFGVVVVGVTLLVAACGGKETQSAPLSFTQPPPTKSELAASYIAVAMNANYSWPQLAKDMSDAKTLLEYKAVGSECSDYFYNVRVGFSGIQFPASLRDDAQALTDDLRHMKGVCDELAGAGNFEAAAADVKLASEYAGSMGTAVRKIQQDLDLPLSQPF